MVSVQSGQFTYASGQWEVDLTRRELRSRGSAVPIGGRAFEIVEVLVRSGGELVTRDDLMSRIWPGTIVGDNTIEVHISAIRKALGSDRGLLKTASGRGYRLLGEWTPRHQDPQAPIASQVIVARNERPATNFPEIVMRPIGRSAAVQRVRDLVSAYRVVTLTGPGGIGKTTLAIQAARSLLDDFDGGGWLVELAALSDPGLVPSAVASALRLNLGGNEISAEAVARAIGGNRLLLVLDNCEHVIEAAASLAMTILRLCPYTTILTTSREVFRIDGENVYRVPPLEVPDPGQDNRDRVLHHSAVELFIDRTKALDAGFSLRDEDRPALGAICRHLDGIPLAIEFAAARAATLGIQHVAAALRDRFALLTSGRRTSLPRHRTMRATLDWSYDLLPEAEQRLLRHLAVFPAGFTLDGADAVMRDCGLAASAVSNGIVNLVTKSLVARDKSDDRWLLLETVRAYALEKLVAHGEADTAARCQAQYFRDLLAPLVLDSGARMPPDRLAGVVREVDNVRAALDWCFSPAGDSAIGIAITAAYAPVWVTLSLLAECRDRCERALHGFAPKTAADALLQMWLRIAVGIAMIDTMGPAEQTRTTIIMGLECADALRHPDGQARALTTMVTACIFRGDYAGARTAAERLGQIAHQIGDPVIIRVTDRMLGIALVNIGRPAEAQSYIEGALRTRIPAEDRLRSLWYPWDHLAPTQALLGRALWLQGFADKGREQALASLEQVRPTDRQVVYCLTAFFGICRIAPMTGDFATAERVNTRLLEVATGLGLSFWRTVGRFLEGRLMVERHDFRNGLAVLRDAFDTCRRTGWRISFPEFKGSLAMALSGLGQHDAAVAAVDEGLADSGESADGERWYYPELLRIKGDILLQQGEGAPTMAAEACLLAALNAAREQAELFWELRAALSLARVRVTQGRRAEARQGLTAVYGRFTEGFATTDLRAAKALLDELPE